MLNIPAAHMGGISGHCCKTASSSVSLSLTKINWNILLYELLLLQLAGETENTDTSLDSIYHSLPSCVSIRFPLVLPFTSQHESRAPPSPLKPTGKDQDFWDVNSNHFCLDCQCNFLSSPNKQPRTQSPSSKCISEASGREDEEGVYRLKKKKVMYVRGDAVFWSDRFFCLWWKIGSDCWSVWSKVIPPLEERVEGNRGGGVGGCER